MDQVVAFSFEQATGMSVPVGIAVLGAAVAIVWGVPAVWNRLRGRR